MKYKCAQCDFTFESRGPKPPWMNKKARDHFFYAEHAGFVLAENKNKQ